MERTVARNDKDSVVCVWQQAADCVLLLLLLLLCEGADGEAARAPATDAHIKRRRIVAFTTTKGRRRRERRGSERREENDSRHESWRPVVISLQTCITPLIPCPPQKESISFTHNTLHPELTVITRRAIGCIIVHACAVHTAARQPTLLARGCASLFKGWMASEWRVCVTAVVCCLDHFQTSKAHHLMARV